MLVKSKLHEIVALLDVTDVADKVVIADGNNELYAVILLLHD